MKKKIEKKLSDHPNPKKGQLLLNDEPASTFSRANLINKQVKYVHQGEIGSDQLIDNFSIIAKDRQECNFTKYLCVRELEVISGVV